MGKIRLKKACEQTESSIMELQQEKIPDKKIEQQYTMVRVKRTFSGTTTRGPTSKRIKTESMSIQTLQIKSKFRGMEKKTEEKKCIGKNTRRKEKSHPINKHIKMQNETEDTPSTCEAQIIYFSTPETLIEKGTEQKPIQKT